MNHPKPEEWVPFLYGETKGEERRQRKAHLRRCPECRAELEQWQRGLQRLDRWKLPQPATAARWFVPVTKWAGATALLLALGFGVGRFTAPGPDVEQIRSRLEPAMREALQQDLAQFVREEMKRMGVATLATAGVHTEQMLVAYDTAVEARRAEDLERLYLVLKKQLDTVAINTEKEIVQLAGYVRPTEPSPPTPQ